MRRRMFGTAGRALSLLAVATTAGLLIGGQASASAGAAPKAPPAVQRTTHQLPLAPTNLTYGGAKVQVTNTNYVILWEPPTLQDGTTSFV